MPNYKQRDTEALDEAGGYFIRHMSALTTEALLSKAEIAAELAQRDYEIDQLRRINHKEL